jgi:hypothetical protein
VRHREDVEYHDDRETNHDTEPTYSAPHRHDHEPFLPRRDPHEPDGEPPDQATSFSPCSLHVMPTFGLCYLFLMPLEHQ